MQKHIKIERKPKPTITNCSRISLRAITVHNTA